MSKDVEANTRLMFVSLMLILGLLACGSACWAGVAAYQLDAGTSCPAHVSYWLSGDATSVTIDIIDANTGAVAYTFPTITGANASKGFHSDVVTWNGQANGGGDVAPGAYKIRATVVAPGTGSNTTKMAPIWESVSGTGASNGWRIYGIAMNNNPDSPFYGRIYVGNFQNDDGRTKAIWELNPDGTVIGTLPDVGFVGSGPWGLCVDWDGDVYVSNRTDPTGIWRYHWNGTAWVASPKILGTTNDRYLGCSMESGANLKLIDTFYQTIASPATIRLYAGTGDPPASFAKAGGDKSGSDCFMQPAIDTDGTVYVAGINQSASTVTPDIGALTKWDMSGNPLGRNANMTQATGCCLTPDGQTLWLARPIGLTAGASNYGDPNDTSPGAQADKCIYKLPKAEAMTAVAYPTPSANLRKYGLQTAYSGGGMKMPRFIAADGSSNLAVATADSDIASRGFFFGLYKEPTGATPTTEVRIGRNVINWSNDSSPEFIGGSMDPSPVECGGTLDVSVTAKDADSIPSGENDIQRCAIYCPNLGLGLPGDPGTAVNMTYVSGPDAQKQNTYALTVAVPQSAPTGELTADIYIYDVHGGIQPAHGTLTVTVNGGYITGVITEGLTGRPAAGVTVRATKGDYYREDTTDSHGTYTINITPDYGYTVAPVTNSYANTYPSEYNLQSDWPNTPGTTDWPRYTDCTVGQTSTANGRVWPMAVTQVTYDWTAHAYRAGGRTVCVTGTVLRQAGDSTVTPKQLGYNGYYFITDTLGGPSHNTQQAVKVRVYATGSECKKGDKVVVFGSFNPPANYSQGVVTPTSAPVVLSHNNVLPAPREANSLTSATLYGNVIGGYYVLKNKTVTRVGTSEEFYVQVPDAAPTSEFRIDMDNIATTGIAYPTVGQVFDIYGVLDEMDVWNRLRAIRPGELGDAGLPGLVSDIAAAKAKPDNTDVGLINAQVTAVAGGGVPAGTAYIEQPNRTSALRIHFANMPADVGAGDLILVQGKMATSAQGERRIEAVLFRRVGADASVRPIDAIGMNNRDAQQANALGLYIKTWGKVTDVGADYFTITDGSPVSIKVMCGGLAKPDADRVVRVRGVVSRDSSGPLLLMRNEQVEWAYSDAAYQPLPFPGAFKYPRDFLVLGPFADAGSAPNPNDPIPSQTYRLDHDFICDATEGAFSEADISSLAPALGRSVGSYAWQRSQPVGDSASFTSVFPTGNTNCTFYAHLWVYSPIEQWAAMRVGSDDSVKVFVNGVEMWRNQVNNPYANPPTTGRAESQGADTVPYIMLNQGFNSVLLKVEQGVGAAGVDCQFVSFFDPGLPGWGGATPLEGLGYLLNATQ